MTGSFPEMKRPGPSTAEVKNVAWLKDYLHSPIRRHYVVLKRRLFMQAYQLLFGETGTKFGRDRLELQDEYKMY
jgi:hypothetical protein